MDIENYEYPNTRNKLRHLRHLDTQTQLSARLKVAQGAKLKKKKKVQK